MVAATKKRGRPPIYDEDFKRRMTRLYPSVTERSLINLYMAQRGYEIAVLLLGESEADVRFKSVSDQYHGERAYRYQGVLEQIGRMNVQDGKGDTYCKQFMSEAITSLDKGIPSKQVEQAIRQARQSMKKR